jgi:hypothetical protein
MGRKRFVDLSISIEPDLPSDPPVMIPKIDYIDHDQGAEQMKEFFPGVTREHLPGGLGWALNGPGKTIPDHRRNSFGVVL